MIDETLPVILRITDGKNESICVARIVREGSKLYAKPTLQVQTLGHFPTIELLEENLELVPNPGGGRLSYRYSILIHLEN